MSWRRYGVYVGAVATAVVVHYGLEAILDPCNTRSNCLLNTMHSYQNSLVQGKVSFKGPVAVLAPIVYAGKLLVANPEIVIGPGLYEGGRLLYDRLRNPARRGRRR